MARKLILIGAVVTAVAASAMPVVASASPELRDEAGKVPIGSNITLTSTNLKTTSTKFGTLECKHAAYSAQVTANSGTQVQEEGTGGTTTACNAGTLTLKVTSPTLKVLSTSGSDAGTLAVTFISDVGGFSCHYEGTGGFTYSTGTGADLIVIAGIQLSAAQVCLKEDEETGELIEPTFEGSFTQTTEATGEPLWIQ